MNYYEEYEFEEREELTFSVSEPLFKIWDEVKVFNSKIKSFRLESKQFDRVIHFNIPTNELPSHLSRILGFDCDPILLSVDLEFGEEGQFLKFFCKNPIYEQNIPAYSLISTKIQQFFEGGYHPGSLDKFPSSRTSPTTFNGTFSECRFVWLINDILSCFYLLIDHCSICGSPLKRKLFKPTYCQNPDCKAKFIDLGIGTSVWAEIHRDPYSADLIISSFSASIGTPFLKDRAT